MGNQFHPAAVCRRGHLVTLALMDYGPPAPKCSTCGADVLTACVHCGGRIQGMRQEIPDFGYLLPDFCDQCGDPHPWASRQARIYQLENILDEQELDEVTRLKVREDLDALLDSDIDEADERKRWERIKRLAPGMLQAGAEIAKTLLTAELKQQLGLP